MTQPDPNAPVNGTWSWAVQRELDGLQRSIDQRLSDMTIRIDKLVSSTEYIADKRGAEQERLALREKITDLEKDLESFKVDVRKSFDDFRKDNEQAHVNLSKSINDETIARQTASREEAKARQATMRWVISMVLVPIVISIVEYFHK